MDIEKVRDEHPIPDVLRHRYGVVIKGGKINCPNPSHRDRDPSCSIYRKPSIGWRFHCHGCDARGDVVELVRYMEGCTFQEALQALTGSPPTPRCTEPDPSLDVPDPEMHLTFPPGTVIPRAGDEVPLKTARGSVTKRPELVHVYRNESGQPFLLTFRIKRPGGKKAVIPVRMTLQNEWIWKGFEDEKPIYGLDKLRGSHHPVLVVEGEKCVDLLSPLWDDRVTVISWQGGTGNVKNVDWTPLKGREVWLWPDADHDGKGQKAMDYIRETCGASKTYTVRLPDGKKHGWDAADRLEEAGGNAEEVWAWLCQHLEIDRVALPQEASGRENDWLPGDYAIEKTAEGGLKRTSVLNAGLYLQFHPRFKGRLALDTFRQEVLYDGQPVDDTTALEIQRQLSLLSTPPGFGPQVGLDSIERLIIGIAAKNPFSSLVRAFDALPAWDGLARVKGLLTAVAHVPANPYTLNVCLRWMVGAVKRAHEPGCQHDGVLVLEGEGGIGKTSFFREIARIGGMDLFTELGGVLHDKDALLKLRGKLIVELAEMTAHRKSERDVFKSFITSKVDNYRVPYGRRSQDMPRQCVFAGTTNATTGYIDDPGDNRRLWPVRIESPIDIDYIRKHLVQLWAEALALYRSNEPNYLLPEEAAVWQEKIESIRNPDSWEETLRDKLDDNESYSTEEVFAILQIFLMKEQDRGATARLKDIMLQLGWELMSRGDDKRRRWRKRLRARRSDATRP